jgi:hypothetical protein
MQHVVNNRLLFIKNSEIYNIGTRQNNNLFPQSISLTKVQKGAYHSGIQIFKHLPAKLKELINDQKRFNAALKRFLYTNSFYSLEDYFNYHANSNSNNRFRFVYHLSSIFTFINLINVFYFYV